MIQRTKGSNFVPRARIGVMAFLVSLGGCSNEDSSFQSDPVGQIDVQVEKSSGADAIGTSAVANGAIDREEVSDAAAGEAFDQLANEHGESEGEASSSEVGEGAGNSASASGSGAISSEASISAEDETERAVKGQGKGMNKKSSLSESSESASASPDEISACRKLHGMKDGVVKIIGGKSQESVTSSDITAVRLTGNRPSLTLNYKAEDAGSKIAGICIFAGGNQASVTINVVNVHLERLVFVGRGNHPSVIVKVEQDGELGKAFADLRGNGATLAISGDGKHDCASAYVHAKGKTGEFLCSTNN